MDTYFILNKMARFCVKRSTFNEFKVNYYEKWEKVIELQYHSEQNKVFLFKCYWYDTTDRGIRVDPYHGLVKNNSKARLHNINDVFLFAKQYQQVYYIYTASFIKDCSRVDWLSILKTKPRGRVKVVQDKNDDLNVGDDVFQVSELVELYWIAPSIDLEENSNFHIFGNIFVDVDVEELNVVLSFSGQAQVNEDDDNNDINVEDCVGANDESIEEEEEEEEEEDNYNYLWKHESTVTPQTIM